jgi:hypothetical protein
VARGWPGLQGPARARSWLPPGAGSGRCGRRAPPRLTRIIAVEDARSPALTRCRGRTP